MTINLKQICIIVLMYNKTLTIYFDYLLVILH